MRGTDELAEGFQFRLVIAESTATPAMLYFGVACIVSRLREAVQ